MSNEELLIRENVKLNKIIDMAVKSYSEEEYEKDQWALRYKDLDEKYRDAVTKIEKLKDEKQLAKDHIVSMQGEITKFQLLAERKESEIRGIRAAMEKKKDKPLPMPTKEDYYCRDHCKSIMGCPDDHIGDTNCSSFEAK